MLIQGQSGGGHGGMATPDTTHQETPAQKATPTKTDPMESPMEPNSTGKMGEGPGR